MRNVLIMKGQANVVKMEMVMKAPLRKSVPSRIDCKRVFYSR